MKPLTAVLLLFALLPLQLLAQSRVSGTLTDKESNQSIDYASVYIDGTTNGTLSDSLGNFHLDHVSFPCTLVINHLNYITQSIELNSNVQSPLVILLQMKVNQIKEVTIQDKNLREENMQIFKELFLGTDKWGVNAKIENEELIEFEKDYMPVTRKVFTKKNMISYLKTYSDYQWSEDSTMVTIMQPVGLKARSVLPLKIDLPHFGYTLYYELLTFQSGYNDNMVFTSSMLGHYYFTPRPYVSKADSINICNNRREAYYNSALHFCRSLFENKLAQNGYEVYEMVLADSTHLNGRTTFKKISLDSFIQKNDERMMITGLKDKIFLVRYYKKSFHDTPKDITRHKGMFGTESAMIIKKDTCIIRKDGTLPYNSIAFGPPIGSKRAGAMLPHDYIP